ncbi:hypothetical protein LOK46_01125 [Methylobacterium sp. NMS14P]|nr:hypothetical protein [Methylobacterium sp. NMS14P]WCS25473.1 hypothetical protein LOK46_01125 [Methylobacterium sp. NMS14P]
MKDLDIGVEGEYIRTALNIGVSPDTSTNAPRYGNSQDAARFRFRMWRYF